MSNVIQFRPRRRWAPGGENLCPFCADMDIDPAREPGGDLLQQPLVAVWILEGCVSGIAPPLRMPAADRWFARTFDRFLIFGADGVVAESAEPIFDSARVARPR